LFLKKAAEMQQGTTFNFSHANSLFSHTTIPCIVIIVGGGLAGLSAAHTVLERGGRVLVLDKNPFYGGNSTKATSGINGMEPVLLL
jgi:NADPH-dependent 2,4-dienoyl-CoA reductase/sulfur reductase-like enzyme